jgi:hypothetical protein
MSCGNVLNREWNQAYSYSFWVYHEVTPSGYDCYFSKRLGVAPFTGYVLRTEITSSVPRFLLRGDTQTLSISITWPALPIRQWVYMTFTYDGSGNAAGAKLYYDGVLQTPTVADDDFNDTTIITTEPLQFGGVGAVSGILKGGMTEIRMFSTALSQTEVTALYVQKTIPSSQIAYWPCSENTGSTVAELVSGNNGTLTGVTWSNTWLPSPKRTVVS